MLVAGAVSQHSNNVAAVFTLLSHTRKLWGCSGSCRTTQRHMFGFWLIEESRRNFLGIHLVMRQLLFRDDQLAAIVVVPVLPKSEEVVAQRRRRSGKGSRCVEILNRNYKWLPLHMLLKPIAGLQFTEQWTSQPYWQVVTKRPCCSGVCCAGMGE